MSPSANEPVRSLGDSINIATRSVHTRLNKLILCRLPLAIPPGAAGPSHYVFGLLHITPIYHTFESLWQNILNAPLSSEEDETPGLHAYEVCKPSSTYHYVGALDAAHPPKTSQRIRSILEHVHSPQLERTEALRQDIMAITGWSPEQLGEQQSLATRFHVLSAFLEHIHQSVQERPHVLLAYAWVLYMALFSGGCFIRATLCRVHTSFWAATTGDADSSSSEQPPVQFFTFDGPDGGDGTKLAFKKRLAESEALLTDEERDDVAVEGRRVFEFMVELVGELDGVCRTDDADDAATTADADLENDNDEEEEPLGLMDRMAGLLGLRARDSVAVAKLRRGRAWARLAERRRAGSGAGSKSPVDDDDGEAAAPGGDDSASESSSGGASPGHDGDAGVRFRQPTVA
jgi:heme oxygenase